MKNKMLKYYLCGPTVYNFPHIGNFRPAITFDIIIRAKRFLGDNVFFLNNITDIDDKIIKRAKEENKSEKEISQKYEKYYWEQYKNFNLNMPDRVARVTDSLKDMTDYIEVLLQKKAAYQVGINVFFDVKKYESEYGKVSGQKISNLNYEEDKFSKRNPFDFVLWKDTNEGIKFDSPFGEGRPGWHTECSCFINKYFDGETIDIHGGGIDLIFPHHENENIQHFALHGKPLSKGWMHFGTLNYNGEKMSKSIGNIIYPHDFFTKYDADTYKLLLLTTNYAKPINLTDELLISNQAIIDRFKVIKAKVELENVEENIDKKIVKEVIELIANLQFAEANKIILKLSKQKESAWTFLEIAKILGFIFPTKNVDKETKAEYEKWKVLVEKKDFEKADQLRKVLQDKKVL
ncbi:cysteinyl-tRNA synthetase [Metamycoplasma subdolum]|uniref:Cysteine--tRNA ligase n=1 Tax=Metamycoplasma subdolum TaxID=92407 RepID=A0A3M0A311_9BACT|nr:cysteine--tRNA ligase [Metamycoplasma subdolum]RMA79036.1 cysteinyl-tRNA synthetase [Metamycoplasma subdolum]WPB50559.1 cysteine--tRNA ligase [Metamycoplasma subdolum]